MLNNFKNPLLFISVAAGVPKIPGNGLGVTSNLLTCISDK